MVTIPPTIIRVEALHRIFFNRSPSPGRLLQVIPGLPEQGHILWSLVADEAVVTGFDQTAQAISILFHQSTGLLSEIAVEPGISSKFYDAIADGTRACGEHKVPEPLSS